MTGILCLCKIERKRYDKKAYKYMHRRNYSI